MRIVPVCQTVHIGAVSGFAKRKYNGLLRTAKVFPIHRVAIYRDLQHTFLVRISIPQKDGIGATIFIIQTDYSGVAVSSAPEAGIGVAFDRQYGVAVTEGDAAQYGIGVNNYDARGVAVGTPAYFGISIAGREEQFGAAVAGSAEQFGVGVGPTLPRGVAASSTEPFGVSIEGGKIGYGVAAAGSLLQAFGVGVTEGDARQFGIAVAGVVDHGGVGVTKGSEAQFGIAAGGALGAFGVAVRGATVGGIAVVGAPVGGIAVDAPVDHGGIAVAGGIVDLSGVAVSGSLVGRSGVAVGGALLDLSGVAVAGTLRDLSGVAVGGESTLTSAGGGVAVSGSYAVDLASAGGIAVGGATVITTGYGSVGGFVVGGSPVANRVTNRPAAGGGIIGGAATLSQVVSHQSTGGARAGGSATVSRTSQYQTSGGVLAGGSSVAVRIANCSAAGGVVAAGTEVAKGIIANISSGGVVLGGAAALLRITNYQATGGIVAVGVEAILTTADFISSGGFTAGGDAVGYFAPGVPGGSVSNHFATGGVVASGTAGSTRTANETSVGGARAGGNSTVVRVAQSRSTGGVTAGGTAAVGGISQYVFSGGIVAAGSEIIKVSINSVAEGGVVLGGSGTQVLAVGRWASGGILAGGSADVARVMNHQATGGIVAVGSETVKAAAVYMGSSGILIGGAVTVGRVINLQSAGGVVARCIEDVRVTAVYAGSGGAAAGGSARVSKVVNYQSAGGSAAGGVADVRMTANMESAGGVRAGGTGTQGKVLNFRSAGGIRAGGSAIETPVKVAFNAAWGDFGTHAYGYAVPTTHAAIVAATGATVNVAGVFSCAGGAPNAGTTSINVTFTPTDTYYLAVTHAVPIIITSINIVYNPSNVSAYYTGSALTMQNTSGYTMDCIVSGGVGAYNVANGSYFTVATNVGAYTILFSPSDHNYSGGGSCTYTIAMRTQILSVPMFGYVSLQDIILNPVYAAPYGAKFVVRVESRGGSGNPVTFTSSNTSACSITLDPSYYLTGTPEYIAEIVGVGTFSITAHQAGSATYEAAADVSSASVTTVKTTATVTAANVSLVYNGSAQAVTAVTSPVGLAVNYTYNGSSTPPTNAGTYTVVGTINDALYIGSATWTLTITKATPVLTWTTPIGITYGTPLSYLQLNAASNIPGTFVYAPAAGAVLSSGSQALAVTFTPTDTANYVVETDGVWLAIGKANPVITWADPAAITYGTALSATQLNATANVAGTFVYSPAAGSVPAVNTGLVLNVTFTPTDATNYNSATDWAGLVVNKASQTITPPTYDSYGLNSYGGYNGEWFFAYGGSASSGLPIALTVITPDYGYIVTDTGFDGLFVGIKNGTAQVRVTQNGNENYNAATPVTVNISVTANVGSKTAQAAVTCSVPYTSMIAGQTMQATAGGGSGTGAYVFEAVDTSVLSVSSTGFVTALRAGTTAVVAYRLGDANYNTSAYGSSAYIAVTAAQVAALSYTVVGGNAVRIDGGYPYLNGTFSVAIIYANGGTSWDGSADNVYVSGTNRVYTCAAMVGSQYWCAKAGVSVRFTDSSGASITVPFQSGFTPPAPEFVFWQGSYGYNIGGYFYGTDIADVDIDGVTYRCYYVSADIHYDACYNTLGGIDIDPGGNWCCYRIDIGRCEF